jgi:multidrug efflux pump subunit AcrB
MMKTAMSAGSVARQIMGTTVIGGMLVFAPGRVSGVAALYESWSLPFSVLLSTPVAVFGAFLALWLRRVVLGFYSPPYPEDDGW